MLIFILLFIIIILLVGICLSPKQKQEILNSLNLKSNNHRSNEQNQINQEFQSQRRFSRELEERIEKIESSLFLYERRIQELNQLIATISNDSKRSISEPTQNNIVSDETRNSKLNLAKCKAFAHEVPNGFYYATTPSKVDPVRFSKECLSKSKDNHRFLIKIVEKGLAEMYLSDNVDAVKKLISNISYSLDYVEVKEKCDGIPRSVQLIKCGELKWIDNFWTLTRKIEIIIL